MRFFSCFNRETGNVLLVSCVGPAQSSYEDPKSAVRETRRSPCCPESEDEQSHNKVTGPNEMNYNINK